MPRLYCPNCGHRFTYAGAKLSLQCPAADCVETIDVVDHRVPDLEA